MAKKSILWKTIKEFNPVRENNSLLVACVQIENKKTIETLRYNNEKEKLEVVELVKILYNLEETGKSIYRGTGVFTEADSITAWCYLDEFLAGMSL